MQMEYICNSNVADVSDHEFHFIKKECDNATDVLDFKIPTSDTMATQPTIGIDTKSPVLCIKSEPQDDASMHCYPQNTSEYSQSETCKPESLPTVLDCAGDMHVPNDDNKSRLRMCDDDIANSDVKHNIPCEGVCLEHEYKYSEDDTCTPASTLKTADGNECSKTGKPHTCDQCMNSFSLKSTLTKHISVHSGENHTSVISV
jgi:hypothetical protein